MKTPQLVGDFFMKTGHIKEGLVLAFAPPAIFGLGTAGGYELYLQNRGEGGPAKMQEVLQQLLGRLNSDPQLGGAQTLWRANVPQLYVDVDRDKAKALGVPIDDVFDTLQRDARQLLRQRLQQVRSHLAGADERRAAVPQSARHGRRHVGSLRTRRDDAAVVAGDGQVRLGPRFARSLQQPARGEDLRQAAPGVSSGQAIARVEQIAREVLPSDFSFDWGGVSFQEKRSAGTSGLALGMAVVMVFLILSAQYEKWSLPLSVLMALPFGTFGALAAIWIKNLLARSRARCR